jgi:hypothetical protein
LISVFRVLAVFVEYQWRPWQFYSPTSQVGGVKLPSVNIQNATWPYHPNRGIAPEGGRIRSSRDADFAELIQRNLRESRLHDSYGAGQSSESPGIQQMHAPFSLQLSRQHKSFVRRVRQNRAASWHPASGSSKKATETATSHHLYGF